jgi:hypothetical protein
MRLQIFTAGFEADMPIDSYPQQECIKLILSYIDLSGIDIVDCLMQCLAIVKNKLPAKITSY